jgi:hypothetical protein
MSEEDAPKPVLSFFFWAALLFALVCVLAGAVVGVYGPKLFPSQRASPHALGKPPPPR